MSPCAAQQPQSSSRTQGSRTAQHRQRLVCILLEGATVTCTQAQWASMHLRRQVLSCTDWSQRQNALSVVKPRPKAWHSRGSWLLQ